MLINHVWQSTVFAVAAGCLTLLFRDSQARVRFWIWLAASLKFLAPFSLLLMLGSRVPTETVAAPAVSARILQVTEPFPQIATAPAPKAARVERDWAPAVVFGLWTCGFMGTAALRFRVWRRVQNMLKASVRTEMNLPVEVRFSRISLEPAVVGVWRPVLLLPADVTERLSPAQFRAVLAHELCHVRRRDNLTASIHMMVEALFWFHPVVWWIGARLVAERERACDEEVVRLGNKPRDYAEGIWHVCRSYFESPLRSFSGVTGADLKKRVRDILAGRVGGELKFGRKAVLAVTAVAALVLPITIGILNAPAIRAQSASRGQFEVASIRPCKEDLPPGGRSGGPPRFSPGRMTLPCQSVAGLIRSAYIMFPTGAPLSLLNLLGLSRIPVEGGAPWINSEKYTITAKAEDQASAEVMQGPLLQRLLENRFKLRAHRETREIPIYELVVAKGGPKLRPFQEGSCVALDLDFSRLAGGIVPPKLPSDQHYCNMGGGAKGASFSIHAEGATLANFAHLLGPDGRAVDDKTGIQGKYDIHLDFAITDEDRKRLTDIRGADPGESTLPDAFTAIQEQLGLKLQPAKGLGEFLVIDHVERPDEN